MGQRKKEVQTAKEIVSFIYKYSHIKVMVWGHGVVYY